MSNLTISLTGSEVKADFHGTNAWLRNDSASTVYASKSPGITEGAAGVVSVPAGSSAPVFDAHGTVYLIGTGSVLLIGSDYSENPFKSSAQSGGSGADEVARAAIEAHAGNSAVHLTAEQLDNAVNEVKAYADEKDDETLAAAKTYADGLAMSGGVAQSYVDEKDAETLSGAQSYADTAVSEHNASAEAHAELFSAVQSYADSAAQSAVVSAHAYTEQYSAKSAHTHTVSDIADFPEIPSAGVTEEQLSEAVEAHNTEALAHSGMFAEPEHTHKVSEIEDFPEIPAAGVTEEQLNSAISNHNTAENAHAGLFATENHTHIVSEITDFPTSLPANGGNADTVGGVSVSSSNEVGLRKISAGTDDLTAGTSELETGAVYLVYE